MTTNSTYLLPPNDYEALYHAEHLLRALSDATNDDARGARVEVNRESLAYIHDTIKRTKTEQIAA